MIKEEGICISECLEITHELALTFLRAFNWKADLLVAEFGRNPQLVFTRSGIEVYETRSRRIIRHPSQISRGQCPICHRNGSLVIPSCGHGFCGDCWQRFLGLRIAEATIEPLRCPGINGKSCVALPPAFIKGLVTSEFWTKFEANGVASFVAGHPRIVWCPFPDCSRAIIQHGFGSMITPRLCDKEICVNSMTIVDFTVDCGLGHHFCLRCGENAHAPCGCQAAKSFGAPGTNYACTETTNYLSQCSCTIVRSIHD
eukprot:Rmarinus@m.30005